MKKFNIFINFLFRILMYFDDIQMTLKKYTNLENRDENSCLVLRCYL